MDESAIEDANGDSSVLIIGAGESHSPNRALPALLQIISPAEPPLCVVMCAPQLRALGRSCSV